MTEGDNNLEEWEEELTGEDFDTAFKVLETARERAMVEDITQERKLFNNAHHFLQEYQGQLVDEGVIDEE